MDKVIIEELPDTREVPGAKRWEEERGEFVQVSYQEQIYHVAAFEIKKGYTRGNHYHEKKEEIFYIFRGRIKALLMDMDTLQKEERILKKGNKVRVKPRCGHLFYGLEDTLIIEYSPQIYDKEDSQTIKLD
jgi:dTDP-4-dehydrorhamnose 3,5-epimerase-like enzyme